MWQRVSHEGSLPVHSAVCLRHRRHANPAPESMSLLRNGVPEFKIRQQTAHKTSRMLEKYIRSEQKARREAASSLGL